MSWTTPKAAAQAIRKIAELGWKPVYFIGNTSSGVASTLKPAGLENAKGIISSAYLKDPFDPTWKEDAGVREWTAFMNKYLPAGDKSDTSTVYGYAVAQTLVQVLGGFSFWSLQLASVFLVWCNVLSYSPSAP